VSTSKEYGPVFNHKRSCH